MSTRYGMDPHVWSFHTVDKKYEGETCCCASPWDATST